MSMTRRDYAAVAAIMARMHKNAVVRGDTGGLLATERAILALRAEFARYPAFHGGRFLVACVEHSDGRIADPDYAREVLDYRRRESARHMLDRRR